MTNLTVKLLSGFQIIVNWKGDAILATKHLIQTLFKPTSLTSCATLPPPPSPPPLNCTCNAKTALDKATKVVIPVIIPYDVNLVELEINKRKLVCC